MKCSTRREWKLQRLKKKTKSEAFREFLDSVSPEDFGGSAPPEANGPSNGYIYSVLTLNLRLSV